MSRSLTAEMLQEIPFLSEMQPEHLKEIAEIANLRELPAGAIVFREGDLANYLYLVMSGNVSLEFCAAGAGCKQILTLGPGELLGWSALFNQSRYTARARIVQPTRLLEIEVSHLTEMCHRDYQFGYELMRRTALALARRLSATRMQLVNTYDPQLPAALP
jgi:CRP/FNR family cyclic AMP-dependent transcriptional regulator